MVCQVCNSNNVGILYKLRNRDVYKCRNCDLEFLINKNKFEYNEDYYKKEYFNISHDIFGFFNDISERLEIKSGYSIIDIGCGKGDYLSHLYMRYPGIILFANDIVDIIDEKIRKNIINFYKGDVSEIIFKRKFNIITLWDLFEHLDKPVDLLIKLKLISKKDGKIFIYTVNSNTLIRTIAAFFYNIGFPNFINKLYPPYHLYYFNEKNLTKIAQITKLNIISMGYNYYKPERMGVNLVYRIIIKVIYGIEKFLTNKKTNIYLILQNENISS